MRFSSDLFDVNDGIINFDLVNDHKTENTGIIDPQIFLTNSNLFSNKQLLETQVTQFHQQQSFFNQEGQATVNELTFQVSNPNSNKSRRNSQNSMRTIGRRIRKSIESRWRFQNENFFEFPKIISILAILRKQCESGRLEQVKQQIRNSFQIELSSNYEDKGKDKKLQLYLKAFLQLEKADLNDQIIGETIKKLINVGQYKRHPTDQNLQQLKAIQQGIWPRH